MRSYTIRSIRSIWIKRRKYGAERPPSSRGQSISKLTTKSEINLWTNKENHLCASLATADKRFQEWKDYWTDTDIPMGQHIFIHLRSTFFSISFTHCCVCVCRTQWQLDYTVCVSVCVLISYTFVLSWTIGVSKNSDATNQTPTEDWTRLVAIFLAIFFVFRYGKYEAKIIKKKN